MQGSWKTGSAPYPDKERGTPSPPTQPHHPTTTLTKNSDLSPFVCPWTQTHTPFLDASQSGLKNSLYFESNEETAELLWYQCQSNLLEPVIDKPYDQCQKNLLELVPEEPSGMIQTVPRLPDTLYDSCPRTFSIFAQIFKVRPKVFSAGDSKWSVCVCVRARARDSHIHSVDAGI